jgi:hypothetical protein
VAWRSAVRGDGCGAAFPASVVVLAWAAPLVFRGSLPAGGGLSAMRRRYDGMLRPVPTTVSVEESEALGRRAVGRSEPGDVVVLAAMAAREPPRADFKPPELSSGPEFLGSMRVGSMQWGR